MREIMSIVVPVFNREKWIEKMFLSVREQTYRPLRLILVDNGSTDSSLSVCHRLKSEYETDDFTVDVLQELKRGANAARNKGFSEVKSRYVMFFDSDDVLLPMTVSLYMKEFNDNRELDIVAGFVRFVTGDGQRLFSKTSFKDPLKSQILYGILGTQRFAVRTELLRSVGGWSEELMRWQDWNLGVRLLLKTSRIGWIKKNPLADIYLHEDSISGVNYSSSSKDITLSLDRTFEAVMESNIPNKCYFAKLISFKRMVMAGIYSYEGCDDGKVLYREIIKDVPDIYLKSLFRISYRLASVTGRGFSFLADWFIR